MVSIDRSIENLEQTVTEVLPSFENRLVNIETLVGRIEIDVETLKSDVSMARMEIQVLARFLKRRLDPHGQDDDVDFYELTKES